MLLLVGLVTVCTAADTGLVHEWKDSTTKDSSNLIQALMDRVNALEDNEKKLGNEMEELKANNKLQQAEIEALKLRKAQGKKRIEAHEHTIAPKAQLVERPLSKREGLESQPHHTKGLKIVLNLAAPLLMLALKKWY